ncbi:TetR family transcriptional regulator [Streptomyces daghestanicus]|uniref:TetR family transcriptional regulator n=2 Tax=Streptomyces TaxID=1883 RepID=A0ABQ3Q8H4_9ACTN|nr:TetR family transcriptional regulator [Streptomyces daghestanicus]GHI33584.1 TetR family transcriptional regulator [Streptomyces daghestanicus]
MGTVGPRLAIVSNRANPDVPLTGEPVTARRPTGATPFLDRSIQISYREAMARTRAFDTEAAVSRAMDLFWTRGYEATSVRDLTQHLGIGQGSLYAAFGDKDGLYRAALEHYRSTLAAAALRDLAEGADVRAAVRALLTERVRIAVGQGGRGCLAVNAVCERLPEDATTRRTVRDMQDASREALTELLRAARERGEIAARHDPHTLASFLVTFLNGLLVSAKITPDARALEPLVDVALTALD